MLGTIGWGQTLQGCVLVEQGAAAKNLNTGSSTQRCGKIGEDDQALECVAQIGCGVPLYGDIQDQFLLLWSVVAYLL